jgi:DNA-binding transcriptional MerR regulator
VTQGESAAPDSGYGGARAGRPPVTMSIGEVLAHLRTDFPDVTISKLRFLESERLVEPLRTPSGYRRYAAADLARLRYILTAQRDHYLPLRVIRDQLAARAAGIEPPRATVAHAVVVPYAADGAEEDAEEPRLTRADLLARSHLDEPVLAALEQHGLVNAQPGGWYDADALSVALLCRRLGDFGLQPRHLRAYRVAADRELGVFAQLIGPMARRPQPQARAEAAETARELASLTQQLQALLVRAGLRSTLGQ